MSAETVDAGPPLRLLIADRSPGERRAIRKQLAHAGGIDVVADTGDGEELVRLVHRHAPAVLVTDVSLTRRDGLDVAQALRSTAPGVHILFFAAASTAELELAALRTGALGFLVKGRDEPGLAAAVRAVARGEAAIAPATAMRIVEGLRRRAPESA
ncbi:response regulator [Capillimicrobium parvum]|uniref:Transcriptional regulatory protein DegU n=1 Tax=Capillimicrobium parvum TaxID=2884022 RepID=A0A9E7BYW4_9ACTN|nr:response regulator transcription factor [Capillimicrobium parvum]UGS34620.1 Transcriptional regulatory protein DegU [Capillimicrobium parvum]